MKSIKRITAVLLILSMVLIGGCGREEAADPIDTALHNAQALLFNKDYAGAADAFDAMGGYGDAPLYAVYCRAMQALDNGKYESAYLSFDMLGDFMDSRFASVYAKALFNTESAKAEPECYLHAAEFFDNIPLYRDSAKRAENARLSLYKQAEKCLNAGEYELSAHYFAILEDYSDSADMEKYVYAREYEAAGTEDFIKYLSSVKKYEEMNGFKDTAERAKTVLKNTYDYATGAFEKGDYEEASDVFYYLTGYGILENSYSDSEQMYAYTEAHLELEESGEDIQKMLKAAVSFDLMQGYKKSDEKAENIRLSVYTMGEEALKEGKYETAKACFEAQTDYKDSENMIPYTLARAYEAKNAVTDAGKIESAVVYEKLNGFRDSAERASSMREEIYKKAESAVSDAEYETAQALFSMQDYKDSTSMAQYALALGIEAESEKNDAKKIEAAKSFEALGEFKDSAERASSLRESVYLKAEKAFNNKNYFNAMRLYTLQDYKDSDDMVEYTKAASLEFEGKHVEAAEAYEKLGEFRESKAKAASLRQGVYDRAVKALENKKFDEAKALFSSQTYLDSKKMVRYTEAASYEGKGLPVKAAEIYESLGEFRDSEEKAASIRKDIYDCAMSALENGEYDNAAKLFSSQDYLDSKSMIPYVNAAKLLSEGKNTEAAKAYEAISEFKDSKEKAASIRKDIYDRAMSALENGEYDNAAKLFASQDYLDSKSMIPYVNAAKLLSEDKNTEAATAYEAISEFRDSEEKAASIRKDIYDRAMSALENGEYDNAAKLFSSQDYLDSETMVSYVKAVKLGKEGDGIGSAKAFEALGEFRDSAEQAADLRSGVYFNGLALFESGKYQEAKEIFKLQPEYEDCANLCTYIDGALYAQKEDYLNAAKKFMEIEGFKDAVEHLNFNLENAYKKAWALSNIKEYKKAESIFAELGEYSDSKQAKMYVNALGMMKNAGAEAESYVSAKATFTQLDGYKDSAKHIKEIDKLLFMRFVDEIGVFSENGLAAFKKNGKWGFIDTDGNVVVSAQYDQVYAYTEGLAAVKLAGKWGFINEKGTMVISNKYASVRPFSSGMAYVQITNDRYWRYVDKTGKEISGTIYAYSYYGEDFSGNFAYVRDSSSYSINKSGKTVSNSKLSFSEGISVIYSNGKYGYMNENGDIISEAQWQEAQPFTNGYAVVKNGGYGLIDKTGNLVIDCKYSSVNSPKNGICLVSLNGKYGYVSVNGTTVSPVQWTYAYDYADGLALVYKDSYYGYIGTDGKTKIDFTWDEASSFHDGYACVKQYGAWKFIDTDGNILMTMDKKVAYVVGKYTDPAILVKAASGIYGYCSKEGKMLTDFKYSEVYNFSCGLARVKSGSFYGFIDETGKEVIPVKYYRAMDFSDDIAWISSGSNYYDDYVAIDKNMNIIYKTNSSSSNNIFSFIGGTAFVRKDYDDPFYLIDKKGKVLTDEIYQNITESGMSYTDLSEEMYYYMLENGEIPMNAASAEEDGNYAYVSIPSLTSNGTFPSDTKFKISRTGEILAFDGHETAPVYAKKIGGAWYLTDFEGKILV